MNQTHPLLVHEQKDQVQHGDREPPHSSRWSTNRSSGNLDASNTTGRVGSPETLSFTRKPEQRERGP